MKEIKLNMEITYYGHSCFSIKSGNHTILFDPFISGNPLASNIDINKIEANFILLSHGHEDHIKDVEAIAKRTEALVIGNFEVINWFAKKGLENIHRMNPGGNSNFDFGSVKMVNAVHSSSMPDGSYGGVATGLVVSFGGKTFYYSGDTALYSDMKLISEQFKIDFAFLCLGDTYTMGVPDAMKAASYVKTSKVIGMHFNTWPIIAVDPAKADQLAKQAGIELTLMKIGQSLKIN